MIWIAKNERLLRRTFPNMRQKQSVFFYIITFIAPRYNNT